MTITKVLILMFLFPVLNQIILGGKPYKLEKSKKQHQSII